jgi:hypothetical protein
MVPKPLLRSRFRILMQYFSCSFLLGLEPQDICLGLSVTILVLVDPHVMLWPVASLVKVALSLVCTIIQPWMW